MKRRLMGAPVSKPTPTAAPVGAFTEVYAFTGLTLSTSDAYELREAVHIASRVSYAVKCVRRAAETKVQSEIATLQRLASHASVVSLVDVKEDAEFWYLVMERVQGGDLFDRITTKARYEEPQARLMVQQLLLAIDYCHAQGVVHHDLRPENILLVRTDDDVAIKLTGFDSAALVSSPSDQSLTCKCGTPGYLAPEVVNSERHGCAVDVWSLGVIMYIVLCGCPPIYGNDDAEILRKTKLGRFTFESSVWESISSEGKDFITKAMTRNQRERWTTSQLLAHAWIQGAT